MKIKTKKRRAVATFSIVAIAALMIASVAAYNLAEAAPNKGGGDKDGGGPANKTMIGKSTLTGVLLPTDDMSWTTIMSGTIKTSTNSDLVITHFQECGIHTGLKLDRGQQEGTSVIREDVRLLVDGTVIPAAFGDDVSDSTDNDRGAVTLCGRGFHIETNILENIDSNCEAIAGILMIEPDCDPSFFNTFIRTKQTHGWQWVALNVGQYSDSMDHYVEVQARTVTMLDGLEPGTEDWQKEISDSGSCLDGSGECVDTFLAIGKATLIAVEDKLAVSASLS